MSCKGCQHRRDCTEKEKETHLLVQLHDPVSLSSGNHAAGDIIEICECCLKSLKYLNVRHESVSIETQEQGEF